MRATFAAVAALLLSMGTPASAHRLDEYLQATIDLAGERIAFRRRFG